jgi:restriction endonuclease Mrr
VIIIIVGDWISRRFERHHQLRKSSSRLAELMIDTGVAVTTVAAYEVKRVDSDYFADE